MTEDEDMSSTSSRPPIDPSDWAPRATRERAAAERYSVEERDPLHSPYAPRQAHERAGTEHPFSGNDLVGSPYAPRRTTAHAAVQSPSGTLDAASGEHPADPGAAGLLQPALATSGRDEQPIAARRDEIRKDVDLERLEESLRWLQRQEAAMRLPRVAPLPLVPGLAPLDAPRYRREEVGLRSRKSLEPERLGPPPAMPPRRYLRASLGIFVASIVAAAVGYYVARAGLWPPGSLLPEAQIAASSPPDIVASAGSVAPQGRSPTMAREEDADTLRPSELSSQRGETSPTMRSSEPASAPMWFPQEIGAAAPPASKTIRTLDPDEIALLIKQGEQFVAAGDLVTARMVLLRAAQAGDLTAALALGATYDPVVLARIGVVGFRADVEQARSWYQKAERLGSSEATRRLEVLADR
jgi:hypothetical protein